MSRVALILRRQARNMGLICSGGLILIIVSLLCVPWLDRTHAAEIKPFSADVNTKTSAYVRSSIAVSITNAATMELVPSSSGSFTESSSVDLSVATNNTTGYELYLTTGDNTSSLPLRSDDTEAAINPVSGTLTEQNYQDHLNTWGYNLSSASGVATPTNTGEYLALPKNGEASVVKTEVVSADDNYTLKFGAAVSTNLPAGVYSNTVVASVVANPIEVRSLMDINTMQEMTNNICTISLEGETKQLTDTRDGQKYWVAKLKDGRCWMVQNLALDITEEGLKATDTDIAEDWNSSSAYPPVETAQGIPQASAEVEATDTGSANLGKWVLATPALYRSCGYDKTNVEECRAAGFVDVSSTEFAPGYKAEQGAWTNLDGSQVETLVAIKCTKWTDNICTAGSYDEHYTIGNYYQYNTATAGNGAKKTEWHHVTNESICPKGWRLPLEPSENTEVGRYSDLFSAYGLGDKVVSSTIDGKTYQPTHDPLYFVPGGGIGFKSGVSYYIGLRDAGAVAHYWSATANYNGTNVNASNLFLRSNAIGTQANDGRVYGFSVRCVNR